MTGISEVQNGIKNRKASLFVAQKSCEVDDAVCQEYEDKQALTRRQNQQIIVYLFVAASIISAWFLGSWGFSFLWVFGVVALVFIVWKGKVLVLTEQFLKVKEIEVHRRRALRQSETTEWLNFIINRWWVFSEGSITELVKRCIDPTLADIKPAYIKNIELDSFTMGTKTPFIKYMRIFESTEGLGGGRRPMSWANVAQPPAGLTQASRYQVVLDTHVGLQSDDFMMVFHATMGGKWLGMTLDVAVEKLYITGQMQVVLSMNMDSPFPHIASATISFIEQPETWFSVRMLKALNVMEIPLLKSWVHQLVSDALTKAFVDPGKLEINMESTGPTKIPSSSQPKPLAQGVLTLSMDCEYVKSATEKSSKKKKQTTAYPLDFMEDTRCCALTLAGQSHSTTHTQGSSAWTECCSFLAYDIHADKLIIEVKSQVMLTSQVLVKFEVPLVNLRLDKKPSSEMILEKQMDKSHGGDTLKLSINFKYTPLDDVEKAIEQGSLISSVSLSDCVCGTLYICVHGASDLLALDANGFSDPYCFIYIGGKKLKSTHYVARSKTPQWEVRTEVIVEDITRTMLSFVVYDWDGRSVSEDDFLGSAHILLSLDEPVLVRKKLNLGYNLLSSSANGPDQERQKLGMICITAVFRPIPAIQSDNNCNSLTKQQKPAKEVSKTQMQTDRQHVRDSVTQQSSCGSTHGEGLIEISIIQATNLVAMDRNGFSDPYCEFKVGGKRKYMTDIKKRTLNPIWDEAVSLPLLKKDETLELLVWDHDAFYQKDFLGSLNFTLKDLKQLSADVQHDGWFALQRIRSGSIQLKFKVFSDEASPTPMPNPAPIVTPEKAPEKPVLASPRLVVPLTEPMSRKQPTVESVSDGSDSLKQRDSYGDDSVFLQPVRRSASENKMNGSSIPTNLDDAESTGSEQRLPLVHALSVHAESYFEVTGQILEIRGLSDPSSHIYYKVRLVGSTEEKTKKTLANIGQVIAKSAVFLPSVRTPLDFEVDHGFGVKKMSRLIFDVKSGHFSHIAMRAFTLHELLGDEDKETTSWLQLESGVELRVRLSYTGTVRTSPVQPEPTQKPRRFFSFKSRSLKRLDE